MRKKVDSPESMDQIKREQSGQRVIYQREGEVPRSPIEAISQKALLAKDITTIPFFKTGTYPPKVIRIQEAPMLTISEDFIKMFQPPQPMMQASYPPVHGLMPNPQMYPGHLGPPPPPPIMHTMHAMPPRIGPLPSVPLPTPSMSNSMSGFPPPFGMPPHPMYDPNMMQPQMDPYQLMNKQRMMYNPMTKKPQNYRTVPCRRFHSNDGCDRGDNCHFIHDFQFQGRPIPNFQSKRPPQQAPNYNPGMINYYPPGPDIQNNRSY